MKTLLKVYIWMLYVVSLPVFVPFAIILLVSHVIRNKIDFGKFEVVEALKIFAEGCKEGHYINMCKIEHIND